MKLADGKLASVLLKACGKELQDECNQYAPLQPGNVAVTGAKNVKCKKLFHVALPDYKATLNPERVRAHMSPCYCLDTYVKRLGHGHCMHTNGGVVETKQV